MVEKQGIHIFRVDENGTPDYEFIARNTCPSLEEFYKIIDCRLIEIVNFESEGRWFVMVVDEEGLLARKPINEPACELTGKVIVGTVVILDGIEME